MWLQGRESTPAYRVFGGVKRLRRIGHPYNKIIKGVEELYGVRLSKSQVSE